MNLEASRSAAMFDRWRNSFFGKPCLLEAYREGMREGAKAQGLTVEQVIKLAENLWLKNHLTLGALKRELPKLKTLPSEQEGGE